MNPDDKIIQIPRASERKSGESWISRFQGRSGEVKRPEAGDDFNWIIYELMHIPLDRDDARLIFLARRRSGLDRYSDNEILAVWHKMQDARKPPDEVPF